MSILAFSVEALSLSVPRCSKTGFKYRSQVSFSARVRKMSSFLQGEYIASAKGLQLEVFFFKKQKAYRWAFFK